MIDNIDFDISDNWVEWQENSVPVKRERITYVVPNPDGSFRQTTWVRRSHD